MATRLLTPLADFTNKHERSFVTEEERQYLELHDDDPKHLEFVRKLTYNDHNTDVLPALAKEGEYGKFKEGRMELAIDMHAITENYQPERVAMRAWEDVRELLTTKQTNGYGWYPILDAAFEAHYGINPGVDSDIGNLFACTISFGVSRDFTRSSSFVDATKKSPTLGADIALALEKSK